MYKKILVKFSPFSIFSPVSMSSIKPRESKYGYLKLHDAYTDVREKGFAIRKAARLHGLPESTMRRRLTNNKSEELKRSGPTIFTRPQVELLAEHCVAMAHIGYGFSRWQVLEMAKNMSEAIGGDSEPTKNWFYSFLNNFPELKMVHPKKREKAQDDASVEAHYMSILKNLVRC